MVHSIYITCTNEYIRRLKLQYYITYSVQFLHLRPIRILNQLPLCAGSTVEPLYNKVLGPSKLPCYITLLILSGKKKEEEKYMYKELGPANYLFIRGFSYIRPLYNKVPLYYTRFRARGSAKACTITLRCETKGPKELKNIVTWKQ